MPRGERPCGAPRSGQLAAICPRNFSSELLYAPSTLQLPVWPVQERAAPVPRHPLAIEARPRPSVIGPVAQRESSQNQARAHRAGATAGQAAEPPRLPPPAPPGARVLLARSFRDWTTPPPNRTTHPDDNRPGAGPPQRAAGADGGEADHAAPWRPGGVRHPRAAAHPAQGGWQGFNMLLRTHAAYARLPCNLHAHLPPPCSTGRTAEAPYRGTARPGASCGCGSAPARSGASQARSSSSAAPARCGAS